MVYGISWILDMSTAWYLLTVCRHGQGVQGTPRLWSWHHAHCCLPLHPASWHQRRGLFMDYITQETPNSKCRLYWCLIEFIDWRYSQACWYFRPALWSIAPLTFSLVSSPLSPLPCLNKCKGGGVLGYRWGGGLGQIKHLPQSSFTGHFFR